MAVSPPGMPGTASIFPTAKLPVTTSPRRSFPGRALRSASDSFWPMGSLPPMWSWPKPGAMSGPFWRKSSGIYTTISAKKPEKPGICPALPTIRGAVSRKNSHGSPSSWPTLLSARPLRRNTLPFGRLINRTGICCGSIITSPGRFGTACKTCPVPALPLRLRGRKSPALPSSLQRTRSTLP